jgi:putative ABC transport system permease protein
MKGLPLILQYIRVAFDSIQSQMARAVLTILIIAFGITALVGILTATDAIKGSIEGNFSSLGANTISIQNRAMSLNIGQGGRLQAPFPPIKYEDAMAFIERYQFPHAISSVSFSATSSAELRSDYAKTDPNVSTMGVDVNYLQTAGMELAFGRNFSPADISLGNAVLIIGSKVASKLFPGRDPLGGVIYSRGMPYRVVGVIKEKGSSIGFSGDNSILMPISRARAIYATSKRSYSINVMALGSTHLEPAIGEATAAMRGIRKLAPIEPDNFEITRSDSLVKALFENIRYVTFAAVGIGLITLLGAAIALMNIMLVSVTERTREIGTRKAMGAQNRSILGQFLTEAIVICQLGGVLGVVLGISMGNLVSFFLGTPFIVPWIWIGLAGLMCLLTGVFSGFYPAMKAAALNPIDALRYE